MAGRFICDRCGMTIPLHAHYVVKVEVYADPSIPAVTSDDIEEADYERRMKELIGEMEGMSAKELEEAVHWRGEFKICRACQVEWIKSPLGAST